MAWLLVGGLLTSCAPAAGTCELLALRQYSQAQRDQGASEVEAAPANAIWPELLIDYFNLRAQVEACKGKKSAATTSR